MMGNLVKYTFLLLLSGCYIGVNDNGGRYIGLDWNSNHLDKRLSYRKSVECEKKQQEIAKSVLKDKYTEAVANDILHKCIKSHRYKFK